MVEQHVYSFMCDEIECCYDCPLDYDYIYCKLDPFTDGKLTIELTDWDDGARPVNCPLDDIAKVRIQTNPPIDSETLRKLRF